MSFGSKCQITSILAGVLLIAFGIFLQIKWEHILHDQLKKGFIISTSSKTYEPWLKTKYPISCKFYFFNWTNPWNEGGEWEDYKPAFEEVGPYTFMETLEKVQVAWHDNGTVSYKIRRFWYFDEKSSSGALTDLVTSVNPVAAATIYAFRDSYSMSTLTQLVAPGSFRSKIVKTVGELLFDGYSDDLIDLGRFSNMFLFNFRKIPYDRFGWWYSRNGSATDVYNVETGENGMDTFGEVRSWNYKNNSGFYSGSCGDVHGSGGNFWGWKQNKSDEVVLFTADLCRFIRMPFVDELSYRGLTAYRYESGPDLVDNGTTDPRNRCFCTGECVPSGVFNASACAQDAPVFLSYPHYLYADPYYSDAVEGMMPDRAKHDMYLVLEPNYGIPLEFSARIQVNLLTEYTSMISAWEVEQKRIFFPVLWVDQSFKIKDEDLAKVKLVVNLPFFGFVASIAIIATGALFLLGCFLCRTVRQNRTVPFQEIRKKEADNLASSLDNNSNKFQYLKDSRL